MSPADRAELELLREWRRRDNAMAAALGGGMLAGSLGVPPAGCLLVAAGLFAWLIRGPMVPKATRGPPGPSEGPPGPRPEGATPTGEVF